MYQKRASRISLFTLLILIDFFPTTLSYSSPRMSAPFTSSSGSSSRPKLHLHTPLIHSLPLSRLAQRPVYCKLDALQASGSFKDRGMAHFCQQLLSDGIQLLISSSGGNAGLAVATMAQRLNMQVQVVVPETTKQIVIDKLQALGADVTVHGANWNAADALARQRVEQANIGTADSTSRPRAAYISPYDHPLLWTGHSTVVDELVQDLPQASAAVLLSVGGGGLLCGVLEGLERHQLKTTVVAAETTGACSFAKALEAGHTVRLEAITTIATSLGALAVTPETLERSQHYQETLGGSVRSVTCTDAEAVDACVKFAQDHRLLVEPACGAALAVLYSDRLRTQLLASLDDDSGPIVVEVCGGSGVTIDLLSQWKKEFVDVSE